MKFGTLIQDPCRIIFRLGPNSETPPGGRHLEFQYGRHIAHVFAYNFKTKADRNVIPVPTPTFSGSRNPVPSFIISPQSEIFFDLTAGLLALSN